MTDAEAPGRAPFLCAQCGTQVAPALLACPSCQRLVHAEELKRFAATAQRAEQAGDPSGALTAWRQALDLLPTDATQHQVVAARITTLSRSLDGGPATVKHGSPWGKGAAGVGALGALLFKFKFALVFVLTKAKLLLFGLTKAGTLLSMLLSAGVYWTIWGWKFAFGVVLSIYVHEMGHVQALQRYGIKATAPMFIPRDRRRHPTQAIPGRAPRRRARRARRPTLGTRRRARSLRRVSRHGHRGVGRDRSLRRVGEPL